MLVFVTAVMHPDFAESYDRVERLLQRTLRSIDRQTDRRFRVIVIGNRVPAFTLPESAEFVRVEFPPPARTIGWNAETGRDKGTKVAVGLLAARRHAPTHVMVVDADDFVSARLAWFVNRHADANGWYVVDGYAYSDNHRIVKRIRPFHHACGSSMIINYQLYDVPHLPATATQDELKDGFGTFVLHELLGNHQAALRHCSSVGAPLSPLPFPAAVYTLGTGQNWSGRGLDGFGLPVGRRVAEEFGLPESIKDPRTLAHSAYGFARGVERRVRRLELARRRSARPSA
jgi:hypothetical protein